ncbi:MAG: DUF4402 domain-containing protein [Rhodothermales bacterium]
MRSFIWFILTLLLVGLASAQATDSESATISADVIAALSLAKSQDLSFGDVAQNTTSTIAVTDGGVVKFTITGEPSKNITFTLTVPANLTDGSANTLPFTDDIQYNTADDAGTASNLNDGATIAINGTGNLYVYLGGEVTAGGAQVTGSYTGTYTVKVDY